MINPWWQSADRNKLSQHLYTITDLLPQMHGTLLILVYLVIYDSG